MEPPLCKMIAETSPNAAVELLLNAFFVLFIFLTFFKKNNIVLDE